MINEYFNQVKSKISSFSHIIEKYSISEKAFSEEKGFIEGKLTFIDNSILEFGEVKTMESQQKIKYRYHYQGKSDNLIFRIDNAKHHPELKTFPNHKHLPNDTIESEEPDIKNILDEIEKLLLKTTK